MKIPKNISELPKFEDLPLDQQVQIDKWITKFEQVKPPITKSLKLVAEAMECSYPTVARNYYAWRNSKDWHVLINYAKLPYHDKARRRFYSWWQRLCLKSKSMKEAHALFERLFKSGEAIPGIPATQNRDELPPGLDYHSLLRHAPEKWSIWRKPPNGDRASLNGCETRFELIATLRQMIDSGDVIVDMNFKGRSISARATLALLAEAGLKIVRTESHSD